MPIPNGHARNASEGRIQPTRSIRHVLVCLDGSSLSEASLPHARYVADAFGSRITLLHVMPSLDEEQRPSRPDALGWEISRREAEQYLMGIRVALEQQGRRAEPAAIELTQGRPAERIVTIARELDADLLVLATHGEGGLRSSNLGSTAHGVLAVASSSVLVVPSTLSSSPSALARHIMVALDGSVRTECVLPPVVNLSRANGASVLLVHVVDEPQSTAVLSSSEDLALARSLADKLETSAARYLSRLRSQLLSEVSRVETLVLRRADQRRGLLEVAGDRGIDLLVLAAHGTTCDAEHSFGSVASYMLAHARLPLLVLQDLPSTEREGLRPGDGNGAPSGARASFSARSLERN
jgi:nucleotide-binding universal stress UspA family protein